MRLFSCRLCLSAGPALALLVSLGAPSLRGESVRSTWRNDFQNEIRFQRLLDDDLLLVATARHLFGVRAASGEVVWRLRNVQVEEEDVVPVPGSHILLLSEGWGGELRDRESTLLALDWRRGETLWESPTVRERILAVVPDPEQGKILLVTARRPHDDDRDLKRPLRLYLLDAGRGGVLWRAELDKKIDLTPVPPSPWQKKMKVKYRSFNLSAYNLPVFQGNCVLVSYDGLRCYDVESGRLRWRRKFDVVKDDLHRAYAEPVLGEDVVYVAGSDRVRAVGLEDGRERWKSDDYGVVSEFYLDDHLLYAKLGGHFYDSHDEEWKSRGPYGVVAIDLREGKKRWKWEGGEGGVTNLLIFGDRVYLADRNNLVALDRYVGKRLYKKSHRFQKAPRHMGLNESDQLVLLGEENVAAFRYGDGSRLWFHKLEPPGVGFGKKLAGGFLAATGSLLAVSSFAVALHRGLLPAVPGPLNRVFDYRRLAARLGGLGGKAMLAGAGQLMQRTPYARLDGTHQYFFTKIPGEGKGLVGVNLNSGKVDQVLPLDEKNPRILVSEAHQSVFQVEDSRIVALPLRRHGAPALR